MRSRFTVGTKEASFYWNKRNLVFKKDVAFIQLKSWKKNNTRTCLFVEIVFLPLPQLSLKKRAKSRIESMAQLESKLSFSSRFAQTTNGCDEIYTRRRLSNSPVVPNEMRGGFGRSEETTRNFRQVTQRTWFGRHRTSAGWKSSRVCFRWGYSYNFEWNCFNYSSGIIPHKRGEFKLFFLFWCFNIKLSFNVNVRGSYSVWKTHSKSLTVVRKVSLLINNGKFNFYE